MWGTWDVWRSTRAHPGTPQLTVASLCRRRQDADVSIWTDRWSVLVSGPQLMPLPRSIQHLDAFFHRPRSSPMPYRPQAFPSGLDRQVPTSWLNLGAKVVDYISGSALEHPCLSIQRPWPDQQMACISHHPMSPAAECAQRLARYFACSLGPGPGPGPGPTPRQRLARSCVAVPQPTAW